MKLRLPCAAAVLLTAAACTLVASAQSIGTCFDPGGYHSSNSAAESNFQRGTSYYQQKQYTAARHYLDLAARGNHPRAEELLGQIYAFGYGVPANAEQALRYFEAAAAQGHRGAITDLGFFYSQIVVDLAKAETYFLAAARCGNIDAQVELGLNYEFGRGVNRNRQQAIYWLKIAAPHYGQAAYAAEWLQRPDTPHFANADQLGSYIGHRIGRAISLSSPRQGGPQPLTPGCYRSLNPACSGDPNSAAYQHNHSN